MLVRNLGSTWGRIRVHPAIWMHRYLPPDSQYNMAVTCFPGEALSTTGAVNSWNCPRFSEKFSAYASALKEIPASTVRRNSTNRVPLESPPVSKLSHKYWKTLTIFYLKCFFTLSTLKFKLISHPVKVEELNELLNSKSLYHIFSEFKVLHLVCAALSKRCWGEKDWSPCKHQQIWY